MRIMAAGTSARLVEVDDHTQMLAFYRALDSVRRSSDRSGIVDLVPGARTVLIEFDPTRLSLQQVDGLILEVPVDRAEDDAGELVEIAVMYDGPDLNVVCDVMGCDRDDFVTWHTADDWTVAFTGFAPGFGYLVRPDHNRSIPRLAAPRTRVPAGSVAMAGSFTGLYPGESPGGWQIVGSTSHRLFDLGATPPAALLPGRRVRFTEVRDGQ